MAESLDRRGDRQPFNRDDVLHHFVAGLRLRPHEPELHHLWPTACLVGDDTEKLAYLHAKPSFFHLCLSEFKLAHTDDEVRQKWRRQNATNGMYRSRRRRVLVD